VLDADMVPQPDFLDKTLGYFENQKLAFIQMPQEFYNEDSIQHDKKISQWHEQALFFRVIQPGKNHSGSVFWCGSPSIIRREALENVGGVATETITEDIHTSVRLHSKGWQSLFLNEVLAYGIAPQTIKAFLLQRLRWAQGTMQLYRSSESPLWIRGLTIKQRLSYLSSFLAYFGSFQKLIFILTPTIIILFNAFPMRVNVISFLIRWIPYFLFTVLANQVYGRGYFKYYLTEKFNLLKMIVFIQSTLTLIQKKSLAFLVTPKSVNNSVYKEERKTLQAYMAIFGLTTGIVLFGFWKLLFIKDSPFGLFSLLIALVWATYNSIIILMSIIEVFRKKHERKQYRFSIQEQAELINSKHPFTTKSVWIDNLSLTGAGLIIDKSVSKEDLQILRIQTPDRKYIFLSIGKIHYQKKNYFGKFDIGVSFADMSHISRERLLKYLFVYLPRAGTRFKPFPLSWSRSALRRRFFEQPSVAIEAVNLAEDNS
jgi:cellulose synthase (UDP-forming)